MKSISTLVSLAAVFSSGFAQEVAVRISLHLSYANPEESRYSNKLCSVD